MTSENDTATVTAERLSGKYLNQLIKVAPGLGSEPSVSGLLVGVHHTIGNKVRVEIRVDENNEVTLYLRSGVPIGFWHEPTS